MSHGLYVCWGMRERKGRYKTLENGMGMRSETSRGGVYGGNVQGWIGYGLGGGVAHIPLKSVLSPAITGWRDFWVSGILD